MDDKQASEIIAGQAKLEGKIDTLTARLDAHLSTNSEAVKALFASRREHAAKLEDIRVDYVPKHDFHEHCNRNREDHEALYKSLGEVKWKIATAVGAVTVISFLLGLAAKTFGAMH